MSEPYDERREAHFQSWLQEHPDRERAQDFAAFNAGWAARTLAASRGTLAGDFEVLRDWVELYRKDAHRIFEQTIRTYSASLADKRLIEGLRAQILALKANPDDAPAYKRIANQRRELRESRAEIDRLRNELLELSVSRETS